MTKTIYNIADMIAGNKKLNDNQIKSLQILYNELKEAQAQTTDALTDWYKAVDADYKIPDGNNAIIPTKKVVSDIALSLKSLGIKE
jgi:hypothetical protein